MAGELSIRAFEETGRYVLVLRGELDMAGAPAFERAAAQLREMGARDLLVDISDVAFIDSVGVRAILAVKEGCGRHGCEFSVTHGSAAADRVFELTRLLEHLPFRARREPRFRREIDLAQPTRAEPAPDA
jgi:anti-sigma B factor antagonist